MLDLGWGSDGVRKPRPLGPTGPVGHPPLELAPPRNLRNPELATPRERLSSIPTEAEVVQGRARFAEALLIPLALVLADAFLSTRAGEFISKSVASMWLHELGHAVTAWFCGFAALPGPWVTQISEERGFVIPLGLAALLIGLLRSAWLQGRRVWAGLFGLLLALQSFATLGLSTHAAQAAHTFGGDGGALVLGALFMSTVWASPGSWLHRGGVRFGLLALGALSYLQTALLWWRARHDPSVIPYGEQAYAGSSDPTRLIERFGWSEEGMVRGYVALAGACLLLLVLGQAWRLFGREEDDGAEG